MRSSHPALGTFAAFALAFALSTYFVFAAVQGDFGLFRRAAIVAESDQLELRLAELQVEVARMENLTRRLSDDYLDVDLLDEQARTVLGLLRPDEIVVR